MALVGSLLRVVVITSIYTRPDRDTLLSLSARYLITILFLGNFTLRKAALYTIKALGVDSVINTSLSALPIDIVTSVKAFSTVINLYY